MQQDAKSTEWPRQEASYLTFIPDTFLNTSPLADLVSSPPYQPSVPSHDGKAIKSTSQPPRARGQGKVTAPSIVPKVVKVPVTLLKPPIA